MTPLFNPVFPSYVNPSDINVPYISLAGMFAAHELHFLCGSDAYNYINIGPKPLLIQIEPDEHLGRAI